MAPLARLRRCVGLLTELDDADLVWLGEVISTLIDVRGESDASFADAVGLPARWR